MGADRASASAVERPDGQAEGALSATGGGSDLPLRTGVTWRDLPVEFGPWQTVWKRQYEFSNDGTWDKLLSALQAAADARGEIDWKVSVDSTIARVHQQGATAARSQLTPTSYTGGSVELQGSAL